MPYRTPSPRSLLRFFSRSPRVTLAAAAVTATAALTAGLAATGPGNGRPLAMGPSAITSASQAPGHRATPSHHTAGGHQGAVKAGPAAVHKPAGRHKGTAGQHHAHGHKATAGHGHHHGRHTAHGHRSGNAAHHKPAPRRHSYQMYDSVSPSAIPSHKPVAAYSTGRYYATPRQLRGLGKVMWIDITGTNYAASILDVEPGDATPSQAGSWVWHRLHAHRHAVARLYTNRNEWPAVQDAVSHLPSWMRARVHWWIADPTGVPHVVDGADATQWYWGPHYDISKVHPGF